MAKHNPKTWIERYWDGRFRPRGVQTVYLVPDNVLKTKHVDMWYDTIPDYLREMGYKVEVIESDFYSLVGGVGGDMLYRSQQMELIANKIIVNSIHNGDIFIFQSVWNPALMEIEKYRRQAQKRSIITIGFWRQDDVSSVLQKMKYRRTDNPNIEYNRSEWAIHFSFALFKACDFIIFDDKEQKDKIWWARSFKQSEWHKIRDYTGYPMSLAKKQIEHPLEKENIIVIPFAPTTYNEKFYLEKLKTDFKDCRIVELYDKMNLTRDVYKYWLKKAKLMINFRLVNQHLKNIYEPFLYNVYLLTHDKIRPIDVLPEQFTFTRKLFKYTMPLFIFRNWRPLSARIRDIIDNYETYIPLIQETEKALTEKYFQCEDFENIMTHLKNDSIYNK